MKPESKHKKVPFGEPVNEPAGVLRASSRPSRLRGENAPRLAAAAAALSLGLAIGGCSWWNLGPQPDNYVGDHGAAPRLLTDPNLQAVTPVVAGDNAAGAAPLPGAVMPATAPAGSPPPATIPATAPSASTLPDLNGSGRVDVPQALSVQEAILVGLRNNISLSVDRYAVPLSRTSEEQELASFDPTVDYSLNGGRAQRGVVTTRPGVGNGPPVLVPGVGTTDSVNGDVSVTEFLPTGTSITGSLRTTNSFYSDSSESLDANLGVTQSLLRGRGLAVNLARLREAQLATKETQYQLRDQAESLVASIETAYWTVAYDERQMAIVQAAVDVAQQQLDETNTRIQAGASADSERPAAEAELATRRENLIDARAVLDKDRLAFLQLLSPAARKFWDRQVTLTTLPFIPVGTMDPVDGHVDVALHMRPDVNEARLEIRRGDLEVVRTKNGLLPRLDLVLSLDKTTGGTSFGQSFENIDNPDFSASVGVQGDWEPINRAARASYLFAQLTVDKQKETLDNLNQTVELQIRQQYIEVKRTRDQIDASRIARVAQEQNVAVEVARFRAGREISLNVAAAQRDLLSAQLAEVQAVTNHLKALVSLYQIEGTLLLRRGLDAPGASPINP